MNKRTFGFIILNIIFDFAEFAGIFFLANILLDNRIISLVATALVAILMVALQVIAGASVRGVFSERDEAPSNSDKITDDFKEITKKVEKKYAIGGFSLVIASGDRINIGNGYTPAFNYKGMIAIANGASPAFRKGLMAHEVGHAVSGLSGYSFLLVRPTHLLASFLKLGIAALVGVKRAKPVANIAAMLLAIPYVILMIPDLIAVIPFMRADEYSASEFAVSLGYGEELRCAYREIINTRGKLEAFLDIAHPGMNSIVEKINSQMELADEEKRVYSVGKTVYSVDAADEDRAKVLYDWYSYRARTTSDGYYTYMLGLSSEKGNGCERSVENAKKYYSDALELGYKTANLRIAYLYERLGDISTAYGYYRSYLAFKPDDNRAVAHMEEVKEKYFTGIYNGKLVSPAGKVITFPLFRSRLEQGVLTWIISAGENYNVINGKYELLDDSIKLTLIMDEERSVTLVSDRIETRDAVCFTGAFGKYTLMLTYEEQEA